MNSYNILAILLVLAAAFAYINHKYIKMPFVIGLFFLSTILSLIVLSSKVWDTRDYTSIKNLIEHTNISSWILDIMLGFLLFAGSLSTNWSNIRAQLKPISLYSIGGVILSTLIIAGLLHFVSGLLHTPLDFIYCLIFGALISPTDPIAVLGILTKAKVPKKIESTIVGESLFNDGIAVVIFISLLKTLNLGSDHVNLIDFGTLFLREAIGGSLSGLLLGYVLHKLLKSIDNYEAEVLLTIAFVMGGYTLCGFFHFSGALAMVIMGLFVGNYKHDTAMSDLTQQFVYKFWELVDVILNAILFISIAFVLVVIDFKAKFIAIGGIAVFLVLLTRAIVVYIPHLLFPKFIGIKKREIKLIIWGGLRGGLSLALVLSLPESEAKELLMIATYMCVVFSILVQGLSIEKLARRIAAKEEDNTSAKIE